MEEIEKLQADISNLKSKVSELEEEKKELEDDLESANNDKQALYDLLMDLTSDTLRDIQDRTQEARESAKAYVK